MHTDVRWKCVFVCDKSISECVDEYRDNFAGPADVHDVRFHLKLRLLIAEVRYHKLMRCLLACHTLDHYVLIRQWLVGKPG